MFSNSTSATFSYVVENRAVGIVLPQSNKVIFESEIDSKITTLKSRIDTLSKKKTLPKHQQEELISATSELATWNLASETLKKTVNDRINGYVRDLWSHVSAEDFATDPTLSGVINETNTQRKLGKFEYLLSVSYIPRIENLLKKDPFFRACFNDCKGFNAPLRQLM